VANDRFCVLIGDLESFAYKRISAEAKDGHADSIALMGMYSHFRERRGSRLARWTGMQKVGESSKSLFDTLTEMYDREEGLIVEKSPERELYKLSLFGIFAKIVGSRQWGDVVDRRLRETQSDNGGWKTTWIGRTTPRPVGTVENLETTALSVIALYAKPPKDISSSSRSSNYGP
jgi:hypothetical protein